MNPTDLVIITLFLIIVVYVIGQAINSVEQQADVKFQEDDLKTQLKEKTVGDTPLSDIVDIKFKFDPSRYKFSYDKLEQDELPKSLIMTVINKSKDFNVYVDWHQSSITNHTNASRRVVRIGMDEKLNPSMSPPGFQGLSPVTPGNSFTGRFTVEDILKEDDKILKPNEPLLSLYKLQQDINNKKIPQEVRDKRKKQKSNFDDRKEPLEFSARLMLQIKDLSSVSAGNYQYSLWCRFLISRVHWLSLLPWIPKK